MIKVFESGEAARYLRMWMVVGAVLLIPVFGWAQDSAPEIDFEVPLIEQEPFDLITLDDVNDNIQIKILPLSKRPSNPLPAQGLLIFDAPELSDDRLQVPYPNVVKYESFNDLLVNEANQFIQDKDYGRAFRNLIYVYDHGGDADPGLANTIQRLLFLDGSKNYLSGNFELALTIFQDIYERDPNFSVPNISKRPIDLILDCLDKNIEANFAAGRFEQVRAAMTDLKVRYGERSGQLVEGWEQKLLAESNRLLNEARTIAAEGDGKRAHLTARRANTVLPGRPETLALYQEIVDQYPIVFVGVSQAGIQADPLRSDEWGAQRVGKLTMRSVVEFIGPGDDGGKYEFRNGAIEQIDDDGFVFRFTIDPNTRSFATPPINVYELSRKLLARGAVGSEEYDIPFAKIVDTIEIEDEWNIVLKLRRAFVRPEALFEFLYDAPKSDTSENVQNGPYHLTERNEQISVFEKNPVYPDVPGAQHPQIIEWKFPTGTQAVDALVNGEIDLVDRIPPSDLNRLEKSAAITVGSYIVPTVHMLIPHNRNEFMEDRSFRNGLMQGIDRQQILREFICGGREIDGCEVLSGPFPIGTEENDQLSYAYNLSILPQPFNDRLGMVLTRVVYQTQLNNLIKQGVEDAKVEFPTIILAHPDDEIPSLACSNIQQMWESLGVKVLLRPLAPGEVTPPDDDWDFLYYQVAMKEPLVDAQRLMGPGGVVLEVTAPVQQNLQKLGYIERWQRASKILRQMHRQLINDVSIIPLWQIKEHYAYRENLKGIGTNPVHIYQDVSRWQIEPATTTK